MFQIYFQYFIHQSNRMRNILLFFILLNGALLRHLQINTLIDFLMQTEEQLFSEATDMTHLASASLVMPSERPEQSFVTSSFIMGKKQFFSFLDDTQDKGLSEQLIPVDRIDDSVFRKISNSGPPTNLNPRLFQLLQFNRTINGFNNNEKKKQMGSTVSSQIRKCKTNYIDQDSKPAQGLPNPRQISQVVGSIRSNIQLNKENVTFLFTIWGQFIDHEISQVPSNPSNPMNISVPKCDKFLDTDCNGGRAIPFLRSVMDLKTSPKVPVNLITTWIDGSTVYGSIQSHAKELRAFQSGLLKSKGPRSEQLLPPGPQANSTKFSNRFLSNETMKSGDTRSNENLILLSIHTIFLREHNRICDLLRSKNKTLSDDQLYTIAKNYITALIQKITYDDYLPILLGKEGYEKFIGPYAGYSENSDPSLTVEFTTAGYRFGHSLLIPKLPLVNIFGQNFLSLSLDNIFFRPDLLDSSTLETVLRGSSRAVTKLRDGEFVNEVRNLLVVSPELRNLKMDLLSINIQRGRDHGLPDFNKMRECYGLQKFKNFNQISSDQTKNQQIKSIYKNIDIIDSYVGIQAEKVVPGSILGQTGIQIVGEQFKRIRSSDRFWYEHIFPKQIVDEIKSTKLSHIILRNTNIGQLQQDVFHYSFGK